VIERAHSLSLASTCGAGEGVRHHIGFFYAGLLSKVPVRTGILGPRTRMSKTPSLG